ncbi:MAG: mechanosensitive ion channel [Alphaproteobacteria bacterium]|nr:mechanosensitive ion channel [Alphaproteobacteria bacterium]
MERLIEPLEKIWREVVLELSSPEFYIQIGVVALALAIGWVIAVYVTKHVSYFREEPNDGALLDLRSALYRTGSLVLPVSLVASLGVASAVTAGAIDEAWLVTGAQGVAFIFVIYSIAAHLMTNATIIALLKWIGLPIALLYSFGWLDDVILHLESVTLKIGNIEVSLYAVIRTLLFGFVLFWIGRLSSATGKRVIRAQETLELGTREVIAKLFEIALFVLIFLLLLNVMGVDLTALAVFGGALGVGLGFGLQQIASNFISGIIILLDRSLTIGDYIQLEDGRKGTLRELNMRSATLETFDGKDIMVPNEKFITTTFTNWTHNNKLQRYPINFEVAYKTDLEKMFPIIREVVAGHPQVLSGDDLAIELRPDAEIAKFGESGIEILVEFWMEGVDDGPNRVGADLLLMIWTALKANGIQIPFPQREVSLRQEPNDS